MKFLKDKKLIFGEYVVEPDIRMLNDMKDVIYDKEWLKKSKNMELYYMYRDLALSDEDREIMRREKLRYDITLIPSMNLGMEFIKTYGHYHPEIDGLGISYAEVYEVIEGEAHYLLQKLENGRIVDVVLIKAKKLDKVIIPPNYGHITINPGKNTLIMANFVSSEFSSIYEPIKEKGGGAYFELTDGRLIRNENYGRIPDIRIMDAHEISNLNILEEIANNNLYDAINSPDILRFLNMPFRYRDRLEI